MVGLEESKAVLSMRGVRKRFGAVVALDGVDMDVCAGEVHGLIGENGAGKSTLMKVLSGALRPDAGHMELDGTLFRPRGPSDALRQGVAMIYQELNLAPHLTVEENIMLGREVQRWGVVRRRQNRARAREALAVLGQTQISPTRRVSELGPGARQLVEVARALLGRARIAVMDEPTSSLSRKDAQRLFSVIRRLRDEGVAVIYISHYLEEVKQVADRYTVLRDGRSVGTGRVASTSTGQIIEQMVGRKLEEVFPRIPHEPAGVALELDSVAGRRLPTSASLALRRGEILGVAGLVGAGRSELLRAVFGLEQISSGRVRVASVPDQGLPPWARLNQGVGLLSENRKEEGLALGLSVADNLTLSHLAPCAHFGWLDAKKQASLTQSWLDQLSIRCAGPRQTVGALSGGNQQKVALARLLHHNLDVLLLDEPTRGVDVGSKAEIYRLMGRLAAGGKAILFVSSYVPELLGVCDRVAVMHRGRLGEARPVSEWTEATLLEEATRGAKPA